MTKVKCSRLLGTSANLCIALVRRRFSSLKEGCSIVHVHTIAFLFSSCSNDHLPFMKHRWLTLKALFLRATTNYLHIGSSSPASGATSHGSSHGYRDWRPLHQFSPLLLLPFENHNITLWHNCLPFFRHLCVAVINLLVIHLPFLLHRLTYLEVSFPTRYGQLCTYQFKFTW